MCNSCGTNETNCNCQANRNTYTWYQTDNYVCEPCTKGEVRCKKTLPAQCVINSQDLDFLGLPANSNLQAIISAINNALKSISTMSGVNYTRTINSQTNNVTFTHTLDWNYIATQTCSLCD